MSQSLGRGMGMTDDPTRRPLLACLLWAVAGTPLAAMPPRPSPEQAQEVHALIRGLLTELYGNEVAEAVRIQYGGSVKASNAKELMGKKDVDGALVGGASLDAAGFAGIVNFAL